MAECESSVSMFLQLKDSPLASFQQELSIHTNACASPPHSRNLRNGRGEHKKKNVAFMISLTQRENKEQTGLPSCSFGRKLG